MDGEFTGWVNPPGRMQPDALDRLLHPDLSEPAMRHTAELMAPGYTVIPGVFSRQEAVCRARRRTDVEPLGKPDQSA